MKTQVEFRSSKFPPYEGEQEQINPGLWGKRLAEYLVQKLAEKGIQTEEVIARIGDGMSPCATTDFVSPSAVGTRTATTTNSYASPTRTLQS